MCYLVKLENTDLSSRNLEVLYLIKSEWKVGDTEISKQSLEYAKDHAVDDEIHALLYCTKFQVKRGKLVQQVCKLYNQFEKYDIEKLKILLSAPDIYFYSVSFKSNMCIPTNNVIVYYCVSSAFIG